MEISEDGRIPSIQNFHLGYRPSLDGLRGLAVLAVTAGHFKVPFSQNGALGVDIFFVLSGFLITSILSEEWLQTKSIHLGRFYMRRILRLYPALIFMLILVSPLTTSPAYILSTLTYSTNWIIALHVLPLNLELGHTWTLAIEEQYYLLWPAILIFLLHRLSPRKILIIITSFAVASAVLRGGIWNMTHDFWRYNAGTDTHADGLLFGSALGFAAVFGLLPNSKKIKQILPIITAALLIFVFWTTVIKPQPAGFLPIAGISAVVISTALLIACLELYRVQFFRKLFGFLPLVKIGKISYGLYLWQVPILNLVQLKYFGWNDLTISLVKLVLLGIITLISYRYIEIPIMRLRRQFESTMIHETILKSQNEP